MKISDEELAQLRSVSGGFTPAMVLAVLAESNLREVTILRKDNTWHRCPDGQPIMLEDGDELHAVPYAQSQFGTVKSTPDDGDANVKGS